MHRFKSTGNISQGTRFLSTPFSRLYICSAHPRETHRHPGPHTWFYWDVCYVYRHNKFPNKSKCTRWRKWQYKCISTVGLLFWGFTSLTTQNPQNDSVNSSCNVKTKLTQQIHNILQLKQAWYRLGVCHGWFHLYWLTQAVSHANRELYIVGRKRELQNEKFLPTVGLETTISRLLDWCPNRLCYRIFLGPVTVMASLPTNPSRDVMANIPIANVQISWHCLVNAILSVPYIPPSYQ